MIEKIKKIDSEKNLGEKILCGIAVASLGSYLMIMFNIYRMVTGVQTTVHYASNTVSDSHASFSSGGNIIPDFAKELNNFVGAFRGISEWFTVLLFVSIVGIIAMVIKYIVSKSYIKNGRSILMIISLVLGLFNSWQVLSVVWRVESLLNRAMKMDYSVVGEAQKLGLDLQKNGLSILGAAVVLVVVCSVLSIISAIFFWNAIKKQQVVGVSPVVSTITQTSESASSVETVNETNTESTKTSSLNIAEEMTKVLKNVSSMIKSIPPKIKKLIIAIVTLALLLTVGWVSYTTFMKTEVDVLDGVGIIVDKNTVSGYGVITLDTSNVKMTDNQTLNEFKRSINYSLSKNSGLANDEVVTITADVDKGSIEKNKFNVKKLTKEFKVSGLRTIPKTIEGIDVSSYTKKVEAKLKDGVCSSSSYTFYSKCDEITDIKVEKQVEKYMNTDENKNNSSSKYGTVFYIYKVSYNSKSKDYSDLTKPKDKVEAKAKYYGVAVSGITLDNQGKLYKDSINSETTAEYPDLDRAKAYMLKTYDVEL